jgi:cholesterol transport system auxiliary component
MTCVRFMAAPLLLCAFAGCSALPSAPIRPVVYDFGPGTLQVPANRAPVLPPIVLPAIKAPPALDTAAVLYRLGYADPQQLRPYAQARWSMPPAQLIRQRLRDTLGRTRPVLNAGEGPALNRGVNQGVLPRVLKLELDEFSHFFEAPERSAGLIRLRATLVETTPSGEKLLAQRSVTAQRPAPSADAPGGVRALTAATDAAIDEIATWLQQVP